MAHSHHEHRSHHKSRQRVSHIMKSGGHAHSDAAADKKLINKLIAKHEQEHHVSGHKKGGRLAKYARGGAAKKHHTQVNIAVVAPHGKSADQGAGAAPGAPLPHPPVGAAPPPGPPGLPPGGPMGGPPGLPPGAIPRPPMKRGGKVSEMKPVPFGKFKPRAGMDSGEGRVALHHSQAKYSGKHKKK